MACIRACYDLDGYKKNKDLLNDKGILIVAVQTINVLTKDFMGNIRRVGMHHYICGIKESIKTL